MALLDAFARDLRLAFRGLIRDKGFTAAALLTFALCLGANVALFAVVNAVLIRPLPYPNPEQIVAVYNQYPKAGVDRAGASIPHYLERQAGIAAFAEAGAYHDGGVTIGEAGSPDRVASMVVTPSFFHVLGVAPAIGRTFTDEEGVYGKNDVVVLSDALWRQDYGSDPGIVGKKVRMDGAAQTIIGVMPADFRFGTSRARLWTSMAFSDDDRKATQRHSNNMEMIARLRPGATIGQAQSQVDALNTHGLEGDPYAKLVIEAGFHTAVADLHKDFVTEVKPMLLLLQGGVLFLLLIGTVNLANLFLVRATARAKEFSVRQVLGAGRLQLARLLVTETLLLSVAGGLLGLAFGWAGLRGLEGLGVNDLPHFGAYTLDGRVCLVALAASVLTGLLLALPMLWHTLKDNLALALSVESRGGTTTRAAHRLRHTLITAQFALAFALLVGTGLLALSFSKVLAVSPGFKPENVLSGSVSLPGSRYKEDRDRFEFTQRLGQGLRAVPGVTAVGFTTSVPFDHSHDDNAISIEGQPPAPGQSLQTHYTSGVSGDFFAALGIPLREGRLITADDSTKGLWVCVIDEDVARRYWPGGNALGHSLWNGAPNSGKTYTIVGVVGATKVQDLADARAKGSIYFPYVHYSGSQVKVVLRTVQAPQAAGPAMRAAVLQADPELPVSDLKAMTARLDESLVSRRSPLMLAGIFAAVALVLAAVGIYGVLAYAVAERRREIGVRMALGALPMQILAQFLSLGARLVLVGSVLGGIGGWLIGRAMVSLLFGVGAAQPLVFVGAAALLALVAMTACLVPALRAARVPPMEALRSS
jgi:putative ABC transport system permease protein